jgi:hypothetical protein
MGLSEGEGEGFCWPQSTGEAEAGAKSIRIEHGRITSDFAPSAQ